jgi:protein TonB
MLLVSGLMAARSRSLSLRSLRGALFVSCVAHVALGVFIARRPRVGLVALAASPPNARWEIPAPDVTCLPNEVAAPATEPPPAMVAEPRRNEAARPAVRAPRVVSPAEIGPSAPSDVVATPEPNGPRFVLGSVSVAPTPAVPAAPARNGVTVGPIAEGLVDLPARLVSGVPPAYPAAAEAAGVEADVPVELVIDTHGRVASARSLAHVGYGLDEAALAAVRSYRFSEARRGGSAVAVRMRWLVRFQLR